MKWIFLTAALYLLSVFAPLYYLWGQDAAQVQLLLEAVKKLENSEAHIANLNKDIYSLNQTIGSLSADNRALRNSNNELQIINRQRLTELNLASAGLQRQRETYQSQSEEYQITIEKLSASYNDILKASQNKDQTIAALTEKSRMFFRWGIIATAAAVLPWVIILLVRKIKK